MGWQEWALVMASGGGVGLLTVGAFLLRQRRSFKALLPFSPRMDDVTSLDQAVSRMLEALGQWVPGEAYHGYWLTPDGTTLQLRASITPLGDPSVQPQYSGLVMDETPLVPLSVSPGRVAQGPELLGKGGARWLEFAIGEHLVVRVLLKRQQRLSKRLLRSLEEGGRAYAPFTLAVDRWFQAATVGTRARELAASTQTALETTLRTDRALELLLRVGAGIARSRLHCAVVTGPDGPLSISDTEPGRTVGRRIIAGELPALEAADRSPDVMPGNALGDLGMRYNACIRVPVLSGDELLGALFFFVEEAAVLDRYTEAALQTLGDRTAQIVESQLEMRRATGGYLRTLRSLVGAMDGLDSHSLGHSDRLARYARLTAAELGLNPTEVEGIALAAYLHDVGMVAIDSKVVLKPSRVTPDEYEQIKTHAELGAQLLSPLREPLPISPMVQAHHERWDGFGYPQGIMASAIPLGARIIAVADLFDAKTTGRVHRAPLPYPQAIEQMQQAAGSHLDPAVVEAFVAAQNRLRTQAEPGLPLARCWEWKQMPAHVCAGCPNRVAERVRCWESPENLCSRHGDACETCVVYTEAVARSLDLRAGGR